jgi:hypothetical protein
MSKPMGSNKLWHFGDYSKYVLSMIKYWQVMDMKVYLNLIKEGNVTIKNKTRISRAKRGRRSAADWKIH